MRRSLIVQTSPKLVVVVVVLALSCFSEASRANILDLFYNDISRKVASAFHQQAASVVDASADVMAHAKEAANANLGSVRQTSSTSATRNQQAEEKSCTCEQTACMCCVDFNVTFIDLGGPGCVKMKYLSRDEGVLLNVSYGDSFLRSAIATSIAPTPTCVSLLAHIAEICARFTSLSPHQDGLRGCLKVEPTLLGGVQTQFSLGCFLMNDASMRLDEEQKEEESEEEEEVEEDIENANQTITISELDGISSDDLLAAVNESAQKGLALFQNWLGISFTGGNTTANEEDGTDEHKTEESGTNQSRSKMMHETSTTAVTSYT